MPLQPTTEFHVGTMCPKLQEEKENKDFHFGPAQSKLEFCLLSAVQAIDVLESSEALTRFTKQAMHPPSGHKSFGFGTKMRAGAPKPGSPHRPGTMEWVPTPPKACQPAPKENQCFQRSRKQGRLASAEVPGFCLPPNKPGSAGQASLLRSVLGWMILGKEVCLECKP